jgi:hypothetical protein
VHATAKSLVSASVETPKSIDVAHLSPRPRLALTIEPEPGLRLVRQARPTVNLVAEQVGHLNVGKGMGRPQRPPGDCADVLFELVDLATVESPMSGIVDPRRELVDEDTAVVTLEQLHADHAHIVEGGQ